MKRSNLITGIVYFFIGIFLLIAAFQTERRLGSLLFGFSCGLIVPGIMMIFRFFYWSRPNNKVRYQKRLEHEQIEMHDELKIKLRDKSGRYAYTSGLLIISVSILIFSILDALEIIADSRVIVLYLGAYLLFQIAAGILIFKYLLKKY